MFRLLGKKIEAFLRFIFCLNGHMKMLLIWIYAFLDLCIKTITSTSKNIHTYYALTVMVLEISRYYIRDHLKLYLDQHKRFWNLSHRHGRKFKISKILNFRNSKLKTCIMPTIAIQ